MKKVLLSDEEQNLVNQQTNTFDTERSIQLPNEMIEDPTLDDDDDDTQSVDFLSRSHDQQLDDGESLHSSRSSLQQSCQNLNKKISMARQHSNTSQGIYAGNHDRRLSSTDSNALPMNSSRSSSRKLHFLGKDFATIKTSRIVRREYQQHEQNDQQFEQYRGYKRMIKQHKKQLKQVCLSLTSSFVN